MRTARHFKIQKEFYIGCTTCHQRQDARLRKFKQFELALHWFHTRNNIHDYIMVPLIQCQSTTGVKLTEAALFRSGRHY